VFVAAFVSALAPHQTRIKMETDGLLEQAVDMNTDLWDFKLRHAYSSDVGAVTKSQHAHHTQQMLALTSRHVILPIGRHLWKYNVESRAMTFVCRRTNPHMPALAACADGSIFVLSESNAEVVQTQTQAQLNKANHRRTTSNLGPQVAQQLRPATQPVLAESGAVTPVETNRSSVVATPGPTIAPTLSPTAANPTQHDNFASRTQLCVVEMPHARVSWRFSSPFSGPVNSMCMSADGALIATCQIVPTSDAGSSGPHHSQHLQATGSASKAAPATSALALFRREGKKLTACKELNHDISNISFCPGNNSIMVAAGNE